MDKEYPDVVHGLAHKLVFDDELESKSRDAAQKFTEQFKASLPAS
jgi:hypothetical protein